MRVDGVEVADAGSNHSSPPAFQIIVLVSLLRNRPHEPAFDGPVIPYWVKPRSFIEFGMRPRLPRLTDVSGGLCVHPAASSVYIACCDA